MTPRRPFTQALEGLADDLDKLDAASAHAVIDNARKLARSHWLRLQICAGEQSGKSIDGPAFMAELLTEAEADIPPTA